MNLKAPEGGVGVRPEAKVEKPGSKKIVYRIDKDSPQRTITLENGNRSQESVDIQNATIDNEIFDTQREAIARRLENPDLVPGLIRGRRERNALRYLGQVNGAIEDIKKEKPDLFDTSNITPDKLKRIGEVCSTNIRAVFAMRGNEGLAEFGQLAPEEIGAMALDFAGTVTRELFDRRQLKHDVVEREPQKGIDELLPPDITPDNALQKINRKKLFSKVRGVFFAKTNKLREMKRVNRRLGLDGKEKEAMDTAVRNQYDTKLPELHEDMAELVASARSSSFDRILEKAQISPKQFGELKASSENIAGFVTEFIGNIENQVKFTDIVKAEGGIREEIRKLRLAIEKGQVDEVVRAYDAVRGAKAANAAVLGLRTAAEQQQARALDLLRQRHDGDKRIRVAAQLKGEAVSKAGRQVTSSEYQSAINTRQEEKSLQRSGRLQRLRELPNRFDAWGESRLSAFFAKTFNKFWQESVAQLGQVQRSDQYVSRIAQNIGVVLRDEPKRMKDVRAIFRDASREALRDDVTKADTAQAARNPVPPEEPAGGMDGAQPRSTGAEIPVRPVSGSRGATEQVRSEVRGNEVEIMGHAVELYRDFILSTRRRMLEVERDKPGKSNTEREELQRKIDQEAAAADALQLSLEGRISPGTRGFYDTGIRVEGKPIYLPDLYAAGSPVGAAFTTENFLSIDPRLRQEYLRLVRSLNPRLSEEDLEKKAVEYASNLTLEELYEMLRTGAAARVGGGAQTAGEGQNGEAGNMSRSGGGGSRGGVPPSDGRGDGRVPPPPHGRDSGAGGPTGGAAEQMFAEAGWGRTETRQGPEERVKDERVFKTAQGLLRYQEQLLDEQARKARRDGTRDGVAEWRLHQTRLALESMATSRATDPLSRRLTYRTDIKVGGELLPIGVPLFTDVLLDASASPQARHIVEGISREFSIDEKRRYEKAVRKAIRNHRKINGLGKLDKGEENKAVEDFLNNMLHVVPEKARNFLPHERDATLLARLERGEPPVDHARRPEHLTPEQAEQEYAGQFVPFFLERYEKELDKIANNLVYFAGVRRMPTAQLQDEIDDARKALEQIKNKSGLPLAQLLTWNKDVTMSFGVTYHLPQGLKLFQEMVISLDNNISSKVGRPDWRDVLKKPQDLARLGLDKATAEEVWRQRLMLEILAGARRNYFDSNSILSAEQRDEYINLQAENDVRQWLEAQGYFSGGLNIRAREALERQVPGERLRAETKYMNEFQNSVFIDPKRAVQVFGQSMERRKLFEDSENIEEAVRDTAQKAMREERARRKADIYHVPDAAPEVVEKTVDEFSGRMFPVLRKAAERFRTRLYPIPPAAGALAVPTPTATPEVIALLERFEMLLSDAESRGSVLGTAFPIIPELDQVLAEEVTALHTQKRDFETARRGLHNTGTDPRPVLKGILTDSAGNMIDTRKIMATAKVALLMGVDPAVADRMIDNLLLGTDHGNAAVVSDYTEAMVSAGKVASFLDELRKANPDLSVQASAAIIYKFLRGQVANARTGREEIPEIFRREDEPAPEEVKNLRETLIELLNRSEFATLRNELAKQVLGGTAGIDALDFLTEGIAKDRADVDRFVAERMPEMSKLAFAHFMEDLRASSPDAFVRVLDELLRKQPDLFPRFAMNEDRISRKWLRTRRERSDFQRRWEEAVGNEAERQQIINEVLANPGYVNEVFGLVLAQKDSPEVLRDFFEIYQQQSPGEVNELILRTTGEAPANAVDLVMRVMPDANRRAAFLLTEAQNHPDNFLRVLNYLIAADRRESRGAHAARTAFFDAVLNTRFEATRIQFAALATTPEGEGIVNSLISRLHELDAARSREFTLELVSSDMAAWAPIIARYAPEHPEARDLLIGIATRNTPAADAGVARYLIEHRDAIGELDFDVMGDGIRRFLSDPAVPVARRNAFATELFRKVPGGLWEAEPALKRRAEGFRQAFAQTMATLFDEAGNPLNDMRTYATDFIGRMPTTNVKQIEEREHLQELFNLILVPGDTAAFQTAVKEYIDAHTDAAVTFLQDGNRIGSGSNFIQEFLTTAAEISPDELAHVISPILNGHEAQARTAFTEALENAADIPGEGRANQVILERIVEEGGPAAQQIFAALMAADPSATELKHVTRALMQDNPDMAVTIVNEGSLNAPNVEALLITLQMHHNDETMQLLRGFIESGDYVAIVPQIIAGIQATGTPAEKDAIKNALNAFVTARENDAVGALAELATFDPETARRIYDRLSDAQKKNLLSDLAGANVERIVDLIEQGVISEGAFTTIIARMVPRDVDTTETMPAHIDRLFGAIRAKEIDEYGNPTVDVEKMVATEMLSRDISILTREVGKQVIAPLIQEKDAEYKAKEKDKELIKSLASDGFDPEVHGEQFEHEAMRLFEMYRDLPIVDFDVILDEAKKAVKKEKYLSPEKMRHHVVTLIESRSRPTDEVAPTVKRQISEYREWTVQDIADNPKDENLKLEREVMDTYYRELPQDDLGVLMNIREGDRTYEGHVPMPVFVRPAATPDADIPRHSGRPQEQELVAMSVPYGQLTVPEKEVVTAYLYDVMMEKLNRQTDTERREYWRKLHEQNEDFPDTDDIETQADELSRLLAQRVSVIRPEDAIRYWEMKKGERTVN